MAPSPAADDYRSSPQARLHQRCFSGGGDSGALGPTLEAPAASEQLQDQHDEGGDKQQMDKSSRYMESKSKRPENNEYNENGPEPLLFKISRSWTSSPEFMGLRGL